MEDHPNCDRPQHSLEVSPLSSLGAPRTVAAPKNCKQNSPNFPNTNAHLLFSLSLSVCVSFSYFLFLVSLGFSFSSSIPLILLHEAAEGNLAKGELPFRSEVG